jgi:hypothetical protein
MKSHALLARRSFDSAQDMLGATFVYRVRDSCSSEHEHERRARFPCNGTKHVLDDVEGRAKEEGGILSGIAIWVRVNRLSFLERSIYAKR